MTDAEIRVVTAQYPQDFEKQVNDLLGSGQWRVAQAEMSVDDHHYWALLIRSVRAYEGDQ